MERLQQWQAPAALQQQLAVDSQPPAIQPANAIPAALFFRSATQWQFAGMTGQRVGLNYCAVESRANALPEYQCLDIELRSQVWDALQRMEQTALKHWQEKQA